MRYINQLLHLHYITLPHNVLLVLWMMSCFHIWSEWVTIHVSSNYTMLELHVVHMVVSVVAKSAICNCIFLCAVCICYFIVLFF